MRFLAVLLAFFLLFSLAFAASVEAPESVTLKGTQFELQIVVANNSSEAKSLSINFYSPLAADVSSIPSEIQPNSLQTAFITLNPNPELTGQTYVSRLVVNLGDEKIEKNIELKIEEPSAEPEAPEETEEIQETAATPFFALPAIQLPQISLPEIDFSWIASAVPGIELDWGFWINFFLVVIAAILLIAFISRLVHRIEYQRSGKK